jgi:hypothetical protein
MSACRLSFEPEKYHVLIVAGIVINTTLAEATGVHVDVFHHARTCRRRQNQRRYMGSSAGAAGYLSRRHLIFYSEKKKKKGFQVAPPVAGAQVAFRFEIFFSKSICG